MDDLNISGTVEADHQSLDDLETSGSKEGHAMNAKLQRDVKDEEPAESTSLSNVTLLPFRLVVQCSQGVYGVSLLELRFHVHVAALETR